MKKVLFFLTLLIVLSLSIYSKSVSGYGLSEEGSSTSVDIVLDTSNITAFDIGFSRNKIDDFNDIIDQIAWGDISDLELNEEIAASEGKVYLYWIILSPNNVSASLSIPSALQGKNGEIDWTVSVADDQEGKSISSNTEGEEELPILKTSNTWKEIGSTELYINTENLNNGEVIPGEYIGELRLKILINIDYSGMRYSTFF